MQYSEVRCPSCGTWRTALVGYSGDRICLTCGSAAEPHASGASLVPFASGAWGGEPWPDGVTLTREQRAERLRGWLAEHLSVTLPGETIQTLALCERVAEVRFALPIVTLSTWVPVGERSFSDGIWTLRVQPTVQGEPVDFVLEGGGGARPVVVEIDEPAGQDAGERRREQLRTLSLMADGYGVMRVPAAQAEERGTVFRRAFMREAVRVLEQAAAHEALPEVKPRRMWARHELVYDATGLPLEERRELVEDWLRSRRESLEDWQLRFLAHCDRAAEVHFALPLLRLPAAEPLDDRTVHLGPWHTLQAKVPVDGYPVDFVFYTALRQGAELVSTLVEIYPPRGPRDQAAELARLRHWHAVGHQVVDLSASDARARGERWALSLAREFQRSEGQQAG